MFPDSSTICVVRSALDKRNEIIDAAYNFIGVHDGLQPVSNCEQRHVRSKVCAERILDDRVRFVVDGRSSYIFFDKHGTQPRKTPGGDLPSSKIKSLLRRTMALESAKI